MKNKLTFGILFLTTVGFSQTNSLTFKQSKSNPTKHVANCFIPCDALQDTVDYNVLNDVGKGIPAHCIKYSDGTMLLRVESYAKAFASCCTTIRCKRVMKKQWGGKFLKIRKK